MKIVIVGKGGSGKDYLLNKFVSRGMSRCISYTTRPQRHGEKHGKDYIFITKQEFADMISLGHFQEYDEFNGWNYGTSMTSWITNNVFIKTPKGVSKISPEDRKNCFIIYLDIKQPTRWERLLKRQDADSVQRRINADEKDFENFTDYDLRITNNNF